MDLALFSLIFSMLCFGVYCSYVNTGRGFPLIVQTDCCFRWSQKLWCIIFHLCPFLPTDLNSPRRFTGAPSKVYQLLGPRRPTQNSLRHSPTRPLIFTGEGVKKCEISPQFSTPVDFEAFWLLNGATYRTSKYFSRSVDMIALNIDSEILTIPPLIFTEGLKKCKIWPLRASDFEKEQHIRCMKTCRGYLGVLWSHKIWSGSVPQPHLGELGSINLSVKVSQPWIVRFCWN